MAIDPKESQRHDLRRTFDNQALRYNRARHGYPEEIFDRIADAGALHAGSKILEIGPGTGQATHSMARRGWQITAVELGSSLAEVGRTEMAAFDSVEVICADVETMKLPDAAFEAVTAFTCFYWLDPATRVGRAISLLKPGGVLAVVDTLHVEGGTSRFFAEVQACYANWTDAAGDDRLPLSAGVESRLGLLAHEDLEPLVDYRAERDVVYSTAEYLDVLNTYSGHLALEPAHRNRLLRDIETLIDRSYDGSIVKRYLYVLSIARKRQTRIDD